MLALSRRKTLISALSASLLPGLANAQAGATTLSFWHNHPEWKDRVVAILKKFESENPSVKIDLQEMPSSAYVPRMHTALAAGEAPDIITLRAGADVAAAAKAGYLHDLSGKLDLSELTPSALASAYYGEKLVAVPMMGAFTVALFYNRDILDRHAIKPPTTWDELIAACKTLKSKNVVPLICPAQDSSIPAYTYMLLASGILGADGFADLRKGKRKLTDPDLLKAAHFFKEMYQYYQPGAIGTAYTEGKALFALGRGAMMVAGSADNAGFTTTNPKINLGVIAFPAPAGGKPSTVTGMQGVFGINAKTASTAQGLAFIQWMLRREVGQMVMDTITLATIKGITPSDNRVMKDVVEAATINDVRVWFELPETAKTYAATGPLAQKLFIGEITPEQFAQSLQNVIDSSATW